MENLRDVARHVARGASMGQWGPLVVETPTIHPSKISPKDPRVGGLRQITTIFRRKVEQERLKGLLQKVYLPSLCNSLKVKCDVGTCRDHSGWYLLSHCKLVLWEGERAKKVERPGVGVIVCCGLLHGVAYLWMMFEHFVSS